MCVFTDILFNKKQNNFFFATKQYGMNVSSSSSNSGSSSMVKGASNGEKDPPDIFSLAAKRAQFPNIVFRPRRMVRCAQF